MKPAIGRTVIYRMGKADQYIAHGNRLGNGAIEHPAVITRVWSDTCVNVTVFFDNSTPDVRSSQMLLPELPDGVVDVSENSGWRWPDRV